MVREELRPSLGRGKRRPRLTLWPGRSAQRQDGGSGSCGLLHEQVRLTVGGLDAAASRGKVAGVLLDANETPPQARGGYACRARAHEWVKHHSVRLGAYLDKQGRKPERLFIGMHPVTRRHPLPNVWNGPRLVGPRKPSTSTMRNHHHLVLTAKAPSQARIQFVPNNAVEKGQSLRVHALRAPSK